VIVDYAEYCRQLETYLCQKNGGHLVRIVGPAFEQVCGWAERGVPLAIAYRGIDRYCERQQAKSTARRRPVRIEFCANDILDQFDEWRRAVGVTLTPAATPEAPSSRKPSLTAHFERVVARLVGRRTRHSAAFEDHLERLLSELDRLSSDARHARGDARAAIVQRLASLDRELIQAATSELDPEARTRIGREAETELAPFGSRMAPEVRAQALEAASERLIRDALGLPTVRYA
jgi:hypothetical protein